MNVIDEKGRECSRYVTLYENGVLQFSLLENTATTSQTESSESTPTPPPSPTQTVPPETGGQSEENGAKEEERAWFHGNIDRKRAQVLLRTVIFLVIKVIAVYDVIIYFSESNFYI